MVCALKHIIAYFTFFQEPIPMFKQFIFIALFLFSKTIFANEKILCSHPQICNLLSLITAKENLSSVVVFVGDHHHYEPNATVVKTFIQAPILVTGPKALHPWLSPIVKKRAKNQITAHAEIQSKFFTKFQTKNREALAHFWIYPEIACDMLMEYQKTFRKNNISFTEISEKDCLEKFNTATLAVTKSAEKIQLPIVITHDALLPLFKNLGLKVLTLKGSGHHEEVSPSAVKSLYAETQNTPVIWIQEEGFEVPMAIKRLIKKNDHVIKIDPNGKMGENVFDTLAHIGNKLATLP